MSIVSPIKFLIAIFFLGIVLQKGSTTMSNIMQYLIQLGEEFRDSYRTVDGRMDEVIQSLDLLSMRISDIEMCMNPNLQEEDEDD